MFRISRESDAERTEIERAKHNSVRNDRSHRYRDPKII